MATLREEDAWVSPIYRIERNDPLMGGEFGISNLQARQLASRTRYLFERLKATHGEEWLHSLDENDIAPGAKISEHKLRLNQSTQNIFEAYEEALETVENISTSLDGLQQLEDSSFGPLYQAMLLSWKYGYPRFGFDLFSQTFSMRRRLSDIPLLETVAGDDSIDVADSSTLEPDTCYVLHDPNAGQSHFVVVKKILTQQRVLLYRDAQRTRGAGGSLTSTSWQIQAGQGLAAAGSKYVSGPLRLLQGLDSGNVLISHLEDARFKVEARRTNSDNPTFWSELPLVEHEYSEGFGFWRSVYESPGGEILLRITALDDANISHLTLMSDIYKSLASSVRTPEVVDQDFTLTRFGALYDATHTGTHFLVSSTPDFINGMREISFGPDTRTMPIWDFKKQVLAEISPRIGDHIYWRASYTASDGFASALSGMGHYIHEGY